MGVGGADAAADLKAVDAGQHHVQQGHPGVPVVVQLFQRLLARLGLHHLIAGAAEIDDDKAANAGLIFQYQYLFHLFRPSFPV